ERHGQPLARTSLCGIRAHTIVSFCDRKNLERSQRSATHEREWNTRCSPGDAPTDGSQPKIEPDHPLRRGLLHEAEENLMQPSMFNLRVPLPARDEVFLMNTLTDAQLVVSADVASLLDRCGESPDSLGVPGSLNDDERDALDVLSEHGFLVSDRESERRRLDEYFDSIRHDSTQLGVTVLTTLQCNFACDYCFQGDHGDYNKFAEKMTLETA